MTSLGLEDKVVLVTGGNRGIGATIVGLLEKQGANTKRSALPTTPRVR
jgi:acetoacetyl-CoA reductase